MVGDNDRTERPALNPAADFDPTLGVPTDTLAEYFSKAYPADAPQPKLNPAENRTITVLLNTFLQFNDPEIDRIAAKLQNILTLQDQALTHAFLARNNWSNDQGQILLIIQTISLMSKAIDNAARELAVIAIDRKLTTRRNIAEQLGVHENTVARWYKYYKDFQHLH